MPQQNIPWWMQYQQMQQQNAAPPSDPNFRTRLGPEAGGGTFGSIGASPPQQTSPRAQGPPAEPFSPSDPNFEPTPLPQNAPDYPLQYPASDYPTQYGQGLMLPPQATGGAETLGAFYNPPLSDTGGGPTPIDQYQYPNPPPDEGMVQPQIDQYLYNPPPDEEMAAPANQSYYGGGFNPAPNEGMIPNEAPTWMQPQITNPAPNEDMIANPIAPEPTQSGLSLSGTPDLSIGGGSDIQPLNYYPDGSGGYVVYDQNWNVVNNMPGTGGNAVSNEPQTPSAVATGSYPTPDIAPSSPQNLSPNQPAGATPEPFQATREGSGMMGTWQDYANALATGTPPPYTSLFDQPSGQNIGSGPLPGSFAGLGSGGGGSIANMNPFQNAWQGNNPYSQSNFNNWVGWQNSQGNALAGAQWYPGQSPGPISYGPTAGGNYSSYLAAWNAANGGSNPNENIPSGNFGQPSHSGTTSAQ